MRRTNLAQRIALSRTSIRALAPLRIHGKVAGLSGLVVDIDGLGGHVSVGDRLTLCGRTAAATEAEIVGFRGNLTHAMPLGRLDGLGPGHDALVIGPAGAT